MKELRKSLMVGVLCVLLGCSFTGYNAYAEDKGNKDGLQPVQGLTVFDANGKRVGSVMGFFASDAVVAFRVNGELMVIALTAQGFARGPFTRSFSPFYFESTDCTGTPFEPASSIGATLARSNLLIGSSLYVPEGPPRSIIVSSGRNTNFLDDPCTTPTNSFASVGVPWRFLIDLATQFQPPFTMR